VHENHIPIRRLSVESVHLAINLVSNQIMSLFLPLDTLLVSLYDLFNPTAATATPSFFHVFLLFFLPVLHLYLFLYSIFILYCLHLLPLLLLSHVDLQGVQAGNRLLAHPLPPAHLHLRLKHVIHQRVAPLRTLVKVPRLLESLHEELIHQRERQLYLNRVVILYVNFQVLGTDRFYKVVLTDYHLLEFSK
jgi:hypothetical protein